MARSVHDTILTAVVCTSEPHQDSLCTRQQDSPDCAMSREHN